MNWFTTVKVKIAFLWMKVKISVAGLEFPFEWAKNYAIEYCLYPESPPPVLQAYQYNLHK